MKTIKIDASQENSDWIKIRKTNRTATWFKYAGGDFGAVKIKGKWFSYRCLYCTRNEFPELFKGENRWQGPISKAMNEAMKMFHFKCTKNH